MWESSSGQWEIYSVEVSRELELARRAGQLECSLRIGDLNVVCKVQGAGENMTQDSNGESQRLRRHVMKEGLEGQWELVSMMYKPPFSLYGESALKILQKVWNGEESMSGKECGLSFLFLYALFQGSIRCRVITAGYSDWWKSSGGFDFGEGSRYSGSAAVSSDSHRFGLLLSQLYKDKHSKSVYASIVNVLGRNKQLCVRMPEFKDTRKGRQGSVFNGWVDSREPRSAVSELIHKVVPLLQGLRRAKQGALLFPPKPPHPELPPPPPKCSLPPPRSATFTPVLSDLDCSVRALRPLGAVEVRELASAVKHEFARAKDAGEPPLEVEDELHADQIVAAAPTTLFVVVFHATWCQPCQILGPIIRRLAVSTPAVRFLRVDADGCDALCARLRVRSLPTIKMVRGGLRTACVLGSIEGLDEDFYGRFNDTLGTAMSEEERERVQNAAGSAATEQAAREAEVKTAQAVQALEATEAEIAALMGRPLSSIAGGRVDERSRLDRGLQPVGSSFAFDVSRHESARTVVAKSMLQRMKDDLGAFARIANELPDPKLTLLSEAELRDHFAGGAAGRSKVESAVQEVEVLIARLQELRAQDETAVGHGISLVTRCANYVDVASGGYLGRRPRTEFLLRREAGQAAEAWPEFLFGSLISSRGEEDVRVVNPYLSSARLDAIVQLVMLTMLRANRMGHISRCVGTAIGLLKLLRRALEPQARGETLLPMLLQAVDDLADVLCAGRHYGKASRAKEVELDPRFLIFEFAWNLLLRQKQVEIVRDFVECVRSGGSKVKQMIMGAGKTTVVAPLLALMLADGKSLLLSVVPKALLEMSRTQMRETFANIVPKRVYTFKFERATAVTAGTRLALENATRNRGVVVATPTSLKSVMLVYIETLRLLDEAANPPPGSGARRTPKETIDGWAKQARELAGILSLFREGVMLLDEVDLILHPLKSELNFPLGEKLAIDCSDGGERWALPMHILDAIFYQACGRASVFEARGVALDILKRIGTALSEGYAVKALQRLPHITLLNTEWYHAHLKPLMAEWIYLWLQKQHLHGISRQEAVVYMLEGAVARSEANAKVECLKATLDKVDSELGLRPPLTPVPLTPSHLASLDAPKRRYLQEETELAMHEASESVTPERRALLEAERTELERARDSAQRLLDLVQELYLLDEQAEAGTVNAGKRLAELQEHIVRLQKEIQELESPRDDSFDNSTVIWASEIFQKSGGASGTGEVSRHGDEAVVLLACGKLEELGLTVRRCGTYDEAVERSWQLRASGHLRCVIVGGEPARGCGRNCTRSHDGEGPCLVCGTNWGSHSGHTCPDGRQGSWVSRGRGGGGGGSKSIDACKLAVSLIDDVPTGMEPIPAARVLLFGGSGTSSGGLREDKRLMLWKKGVSVTEDKATLLEWAEAQPGWTLGDDEDDEAEAAPPPVLRRELSSGLRTLKQLRQRLADVERMKEAAQQQEDGNMSAHRQVMVAKHAELEENILHQLNYLAEATSWTREVLGDEVLEVPSSSVGPTNGRDAALAMAHLKTYREGRNVTVEGLDKAEREQLLQAARRVAAEHKWLSQAALAAKVMAHVTSSTQKKLLNLAYDWLRTFLPHVLAKVNRVSYGLLSSEDCAAAIEEAPNVPRSRLKLCVPFVGKDVPSKSSEFAHPDVIIGVTILAYRYSGMRYEDFVDLVDSLTSEFVQEIGPARERPASRRHESWVLAGGGRIRGITKPGSGIVSGLVAESAGTEVVQLKFLQKSNAEQMEKLFGLWRLEPLAIHYYLTKFIFPAYMLSQRVKLSASGQAVGGDMLVGRRVGFSGTPSDLLPKELGRCDYATGDDGKMLTTILDPAVATHELLPGDWSVPSVLQRVARSSEPRYHALIDTGALITGYSNREVAALLLEEGLEWCDGVVFLDDNDEKQVLVRATGRAVPADQCGVPLDRRFAFYDQIHTTGMDIKHVVNAVAVITLGKDMVFRDYVQGAYRMRGIGVGQRVHIYMIPEVHDLILRELRAAGGACLAMAAACALGGGGVRMLESVVSWLVINSMRTEQTQWSMLCLQNVANIYRKNAFARVLGGVEEFGSGPVDQRYPPVAAEGSVMNLPLRRSLRIFDEHIDFSLEASVPDPIPFEKKLREMLTTHDDLILTSAEHALGHALMEEVSAFALVSEAGNLDTEQEREQEQEQEKEVKARRDQQVEVEKFVEREYSRHQERPNPWPVSMLAVDPPADATGSSLAGGGGHPFYPLKDFSLLLHGSLPFPAPMLLSRNYYHPGWSGLRRLKNVVVIMEWAPSTDPSRLRLLTDDDHTAATRLCERQEAAVARAHALLAFHKTTGGGGRLSREGLADAVHAALCAPPEEGLVDALYRDFADGGEEGGLSAAALRRLLASGRLRPEHHGRYWVALSLAEAETLRRVLHLRRDRTLLGMEACNAAEVALHLSQPAAASSANIGSIGSAARGWTTALDASRGWRAGSGSSGHESAAALGAFRFFDCDMHYSKPMLARLVRALQHAAPHDREQFFLATVGARRRMERKWQETPLAAVFSVEDEWVALKQRAQAAFVREALRAREVTSWEAFVAFDADNNARLSPAELYGALRWLGVPGLTADDVVDFFELADSNRDGMIDYPEYHALFEEEDETGKKNGAGEDGLDMDEDVNAAKAAKEPLAKVEPYGADELREVMVMRRKRELDRQRLEQARRAAQQAAMDLRVYREELQASARRAGGSNPRICRLDTDPESVAEYSPQSVMGSPPFGSSSGSISEHEAKPNRLVVFSFFSNRHPLRVQVSGKSKYVPVFIDEVRRGLASPRCALGHELKKQSNWTQCQTCSKYGPTARSCMICWVFMCLRCSNAHEEDQVKERSDPAGKHTYLQCELGSDITVQVPPPSVDAEEAAVGESSDATVTGSVAQPIAENFSVTVEFKIAGLPARGQLAALLRFSPPDMAQARRRHIASLYVNSEGNLVHDPEVVHVQLTTDKDNGKMADIAEEKATTEETDADKDKTVKKDEPPQLRENRWTVLTAAVEVSEGRLSVYLDGQLANCFEGIDPAQLRMGPRLVVLGGGKVQYSHK
mmetsp:Transcript_74196/g.197960  ORF Transcript_74196/g.197960 Transcript_74196/m.197960 type:complete len:3050 (-) Transcript_74196:601-9750(-)